MLNSNSRRKACRPTGGGAGNRRYLILKTKAVRLYGKNDLRLEEFELPEIREDEILARVISDSLCLSSYKATIQGADHKRVPKDVDKNPIIIGHEFSGQILKVGQKWADRFSAGEKFSIQPALNYKGSMASPGYSFPYIGGDATYIIIPNEVMECDCLLKYTGDGYFGSSLSEPLSCVAGTFKAMYHTRHGVYEHDMGIREGGSMAMLAAVGPMGLAAIDYILNCDRRPARLAVTDISAERLARAERLLSPAYAKARGVELIYMNTADDPDATAKLRAFSADGKGFDDVLVFAPVAPVVEMGDALLADDGCLNFFAGPSKTDFSAKFNFYNVHYLTTHIVGTSGGNTDDMREVLAMMAKKQINPAILVTHIGGIDSVIDATMQLPTLPGAKKLIYTGINLPLTAIADFAEKGKTDPFFAKLAELTAKTDGLWNKEAEDFILSHYVW